MFLVGIKFKLGSFPNVLLLSFEKYRKFKIILSGHPYTHTQWENGTFIALVILLK